MSSGSNFAIYTSVAADNGSYEGYFKVFSKTWMFFNGRKSGRKNILQHDILAGHRMGGVGRLFLKIIPRISSPPKFPFPVPIQIPALASGQLWEPCCKTLLYMLLSLNWTSRSPWNKWRKLKAKNENFTAKIRNCMATIDGYGPRLYQ